MAAIPPASSCAIASGWITCRALRIGFRSRGWRRRRRQSRPRRRKLLSRMCSAGVTPGPLLKQRCGLRPVRTGKGGKRRPRTFFVSILSAAKDLARRTRKPGEVIFDADGGDVELVNSTVAQDLEIDVLAGPIVAERLVENPPFVHVGVLDRNNQVALLQAGFLTRTTGHHARDHNVVAQRV